MIRMLEMISGILQLLTTRWQHGMRREGQRWAEMYEVESTGSEQASQEEVRVLDTHFVWMLNHQE